MKPATMEKTKQKTYKYADCSPFQPKNRRRWRYRPKAIHVISDHVSTGSQAQNRPHDWYAQIEPANVPIVQKVKPKPANLKANKSRVSWPGSLSTHFIFVRFFKI